MLGTLDKLQIDNIIASQRIGRLACVDGNKPYIVPVTYAYDGKYIYGQSNEGRKLLILKKNPNVCFEIDIIFNMRNWQSVIVKGKFEALEGEHEAHAREILFNSVYTLMTSSTVHKHEHATTATIDDSNRVKVVMYRIKIESITGRYETE